MVLVLYKRIVYNKNLKVDYKEAHKILEKEREKSIEFLSKALNVNKIKKNKI